MPSKTSPMLNKIRVWITNNPGELPRATAQHFNVPLHKIYTLRSELKKKGVKIFGGSSRRRNNGQAAGKPKKSKRTCKHVVPDKELDDKHKANVEQARAQKPTGPVIGFAEPTTVHMAIQLPDEDGVLVVKLQNHRGNVISTLTIDENGLTYQKANGKKTDNQMLTWSILEKLSSLGFA